MGEARTLLQQSLQGGAPMEAATGEDTGTTVVHDPLNLRGHLASGDWSRDASLHTASFFWPTPAKPFE